MSDFYIIANKDNLVEFIQGLIPLDVSTWSNKFGPIYKNEKKARKQQRKRAGLESEREKDIVPIFYTIFWERGISKHTLHTVEILSKNIRKFIKSHIQEPDEPISPLQEEKEEKEEEEDIIETLQEITSILMVAEESDDALLEAYKKIGIIIIKGGCNIMKRLEALFPDENIDCYKDGAKLVDIFPIVVDIPEFGAIVSLKRYTKEENE